MNSTALQGLLCEVPANLKENIQGKQAKEEEDKCHDHKRYFLSTLIKKHSRTNKEVVVQLSSSSEGSRGRNHRKEIFDEKSMKILKSSSFPASLVPSNSLNYSRKLSEEDFLKRKYMTTNEQSANKLLIAANEGAKGKKSLAVIIDSPSKESYTQIVTDSTISSSSE
uniref:Uncharacterized protein n=1 Tax=Onchocerca volvulus TaxID=6282 RepID=A0A8R1TJY4_ONCVO